MKIKPKRYIVWSVDEVDLDNPFQRKWYIEQVLIHGRTEDIRDLDWGEVRKLLPDLTLPKEVRSVWNEIFSEMDKSGAAN